MSQFADIAFPTAVRKEFTYGIPEDLKASLKPGMRVWVPLRKHTSIGMVVCTHSNTPDYEVRPVRKQLDTHPVVTSEILTLTEWVHTFYYASWGEVIQAALPAGLNFYAEKKLQLADQVPNNLNSPQKEITEAVESNSEMTLDEAQKRWNDGAESSALESLLDNGVLEVWEYPVRKVTPKMIKIWDWKTDDSRAEAEGLVESYRQKGKMHKWIQALEKLLDEELPAAQQQLTDREIFEHYTLNRIAKEEVIEAREVPSHQVKPRLEYAPEKIKTLNLHQEMAFGSIKQAIKADTYQAFLLHGVTGSGKTEVYIHALKYALDKGLGGLILVPEIALTPQTVRRFYQIFGNKIAVLHSRMSSRERYDSWLALRKGEKRIAIGPRSAVFAPIENLGLIVVDEEHDSSYKQVNPSPRYHARDVAVMRALFNNAAIVMGTATPSMVSYHRALTKKYELLDLPARHANATMPEVNILDLKQYRYAMKGPLAVPLYQQIKQVLSRQEQAIILYNRRGFASYQLCLDCGHVQECPNCSVSLTFHKRFNQLRCHYCGYTTRIRKQCEECGKSNLEHQGSGTQQVEEAIEELFAEARILRMDQDTTSRKGSHDRILQAFANREYDILVGTQLVAKGLDFPEVTLVGVVNADTELAFPSFNSGERMYQLLSQVAGRSGRAQKKGTVFLQTWQPEHDAIKHAQQHDYVGFAKKEMAFRRTRYYPPFSRLIKVIFKSRNMQRTGTVAQSYADAIRKVATDFPVLGPSPSAIARIQQYYRWECYLKLPITFNTREIEQLLDVINEQYKSNKPPKASTVRINIHVDAIS